MDLKISKTNEKNKTKNKILLFLILLSFIGILLSSYSLYSHYSVSKSFCDINEKFNCDVVNKGPYSTIFNIPVALIGLLGYSVLFLLSFLKYNNFYKEKIKNYLVVLIVFAFLFSSYLTYLEAFVIKAYCIICLISYAVVILMLLLTFFYKEQ